MDFTIQFPANAYVETPENAYIVGEIIAEHVRYFYKGLDVEHVEAS